MGEALYSTCHIYNKVSFKKLCVSPYKIWNNKKPNLSYFTVWECVAFYKDPNPHKTKLRPKGLKSMLIGYAQIVRKNEYYR